MGYAEIDSRLIRLKSVTHIWVEQSRADGQDRVDARPLLQILGADGPEPAFPRLRKLGLHVDGYQWSALEVLEMVSARFSQPTRTCPQLVVSVRDRGRGYKGSAFAFSPDTLSTIHAIEGVTVVFEDPADPK